LEKRIGVTLKEIERAEDRIEAGLGEKYRRLSDKCSSYYIGLDRLKRDKKDGK